MLQSRLFVFCYDLIIRLYFIGIRLAALFNPKAKEWVSGRERLFDTLRSKIISGDRLIWVHCASAGEFEQGKPVIEALKEKYPGHKILVSFFSPSGYGTAKKYAQADLITYLPLDTRKNARRFVELVKPDLVVFVKYEFWYHHLAAVAFKHVPLLLVSGIFRKEQAFFKWYGGRYRQVLFLFRHLFVQDADSLQLLKTHQIFHSSIGGDTRFDRVRKIRDNFSELDTIKTFADGDELIVAGSTWAEDEKLLADYVKKRKIKMIIAPHGINDSHLQQIGEWFPAAMRYSDYKNDPRAGVPVLVIDNIGMLSRLYQYATVTYIGGGFNKSGIHNTLEAAVYGKPVIFGPNYQKFKEARELVEKGGGFSISDAQSLTKKMDHLLNDPNALNVSSGISLNYVEQNTGATSRFLQFIQENRLLTR